MRYQRTDGTLIRRFEFSYDDSNNRESMLDVTPTQAVRWDYGFDWLDRLVTVKRAEAADVGSLSATTLQREYVFDESDNRTFFDDHVAGVTYHYTYKSIDDNGTTRYSDQLEEILVSTTVGDRTLPGNFSSFETFLSDEDGNLISRTVAATGEVISHEFDDFDRLKRVESSTEGRKQDNRYDVNGLRERKLDKGGNSSVEYGVGIMTSASVPGSGSSAAPSISYVMGHMLLGAEVDGNFVFHLTDALSTVRDVVDDTGNVIRSFEFSEYGDLLSSSGTGAASPKTWIGGLSVNDDTADSGMFNMGHRNYSAGVLGRFISRDPIGHRGNLNLYAYPTNPVNFVDPSGLKLTVTGSHSDLFLSYLGQLTGLTLVNNDGNVTECLAAADPLFPQDPELRDLVRSIIDNKLEHRVEVDYLSGKTPIGRFIGNQVQRVDIGDIMSIAETSPDLAAAFVGHELTELFESTNANAVPIATEQNWRQVFAELHRRGLRYERSKGCKRVGEGMNKITDTHQTGHFEYEGKGKFFFRNNQGSFQWARGL